MSDVKLQKYGTREQVYQGLAQMTKGKLKKDDLSFCEKTGRYKSIKAMQRGRDLVENMKKPKVVKIVPEIEEVPIVVENRLKSTDFKQRQRKKKIAPES